MPKGYALYRSTVCFVGSPRYVYLLHIPLAESLLKCLAVQAVDVEWQCYIAQKKGVHECYHTTPRMTVGGYLQVQTWFLLQRWSLGWADPH